MNRVRQGRAVPFARQHAGFATSFADPADIARFRACRREGYSEKFCFGRGDNGIGKWGDDTTADSPMCALPPPEIIRRWKSLDAGRGKRVVVIANSRAVCCRLADIMPWKPKNGAVIDLNAAAVRALGLKPPIKVPATWVWDDDT